MTEKKMIELTNNRRKKAKYSRFDLKRVTKTLYDMQDIRKRIEGRLGLRKDGTLKVAVKGDGVNLKAEIEPDVAAALHVLLDQIKDKEKELGKLQKEMIDDSFPFGEVLRSYQGIDYKLAGVILSEYDIVEATTVSKMWRFGGMDPTAKSKKGEKNKYSKFLKSKLLGTFGHMQIKMAGKGNEARGKEPHPMRAFYEARKMRYTSQNWGTRPGHRDNAAVRYAVKMWIATWLYPTWRAFEGLPVRPPYQEEYLGKKHGEPSGGASGSGAAA